MQEELLKLKLERAAMLVDGLSGERVRWENSVQDLNSTFNLLPGDCLIATAFISYLGPFISNYRSKLVQIWTTEVTFYKKFSEIKLHNDIFYCIFLFQFCVLYSKFNSIMIHLIIELNYVLLSKFYLFIFT
jgi:uncharacterized protein YybS (DUF2232 family)